MYCSAKRTFPAYSVLAILILLPFGDQPAEAQGKAPATTFLCHWTEGEIEIDGRLDESAWQQAQLIDHFYLPWLSEEVRPTPAATRARLLWDRQYLYFCAELVDHDLFADVTQHDGRTWDNDVIELFIKPAADKPGYYEFQVNAANTRLDMYIPRMQRGFFEKFIAAQPFHLESAVVHRGTLNKRKDRDEGWTVEARIPWTDFIRTGGRPAVGETWRFAFCRYDYTIDTPEPVLSTCARLTKPHFHRHQDYASIQFMGQEKSAAHDAPDPLPWTTSRVVGSPEPPYPFRVIKVFPNLELELPICLRFVPGTNQMLIVDEPMPFKPARLLQTRTDPDVDSYRVLIDYEPIEGLAFDITFHPQFSKNGFVFIGSNSRDDDGVFRSRVTRYQMQTEPPYQFDADSAKLILKWPSDGHNGAAVVFGNDGMLYVTTGDGTSDSDEDVVGQRLDLLHGKVLRLDVDHPDEGRAYSVPPDNPFVAVPNARPETYAYGLRNPWRIAVDRDTGHIWVGNNGQDLWESAYLIQRGGNYGWSVYEGSHPFYLHRQRGPTPILPPTVEHHHADARSLTGGIVYRGSDFPELDGAYVYGDYETGKIWAVKHDGQQILWHRELADTTMRITCFAEDQRGELLITDQQSKQDGGIYRLERNPSVDRPSDFPEWLSETGLFASTAQHRPQTGVLPYEVNAPAWHDGAIAERLLAIPAEPQPDRSWDIPSIGFHPTSSWRFPEGTVLAQTLTLETDPGNPQSRRRMETRLMTFQHGDWDGYSYVWNEDQTDARLVEKSGTAVQLTMGSANAHSLRTWRVPSRSECEACHSRQAGFVLGMNAPQLNRSQSYNGHVVNQLRYLEQKQLVVDDWSARANDYWSNFVVEELKAANQLDLENRRVRQEQVKLRLEELTVSTGQRQAPPTTLLGKSSEAYASLADPYGDTAALELRARSYLHVNCSSCHVRSGGGNAQINLSAHASDADLNVLGEKPLHGDFGLTDAKLVAPGSPCRSVINYRMSTVTGGRMPRVGSHQVDVQGAKLIRDWIRSLDPGVASDDPFQQAVNELVSASPGHATTVAVKLLSSPSGALALIAAMDQGLLPSAVQEEILQRALASPDRNIQRLFERYLPEGERKQTLGTNIVAADVLKLTGDASRGQQLFLENEALACVSCHAYENRGHQVGPDLTRLGHAEAGARKEYSRAEILDSLLHPSRKIDEQYAAYTLFTANGKVHSGLLVEQTDEFVTLKQAGGQTIRAETEEIDELSRHPKSLMPDHLLRDLSAQEAADLLAFLVGLLES